MRPHQKPIAILFINCHLVSPSCWQLQDPICLHIGLVYYPILFTIPTTHIWSWNRHLVTYIYLFIVHHAKFLMGNSRFFNVYKYIIWSWFLLVSFVASKLCCFSWFVYINSCHLSLFWCRPLLFQFNVCFLVTTCFDNSSGQLSRILFVQCLPLLPTFLRLPFLLFSVVYVCGCHSVWSSLAD